MKTRLLSIGLAVLLVLGPVAPGAHAHHGWNWAEPENSELVGTIKKARLGNPHGELTLDVNGEQWIAEIGQPWRNQRTGLQDDMLVEGVQVTVRGHKSARGERLIKAERVLIDGKTYDLYPGRD